MAEDITRVLDKVKKLLALSTSSNPNEAASAAAKAQALLEQYNLELSSVETADQAAAYSTMDVHLGAVRVWRRSLLAVIARAHFCDVVIHSGTDKATIVGQAHNSQVVHYLYGYLAGQLEGMAAKAYRHSGSGIPPLTWKDAFFMGAIQSIGARLQTQHQTFTESSEVSRALVVVKDAELHKAVSTFFPKLRAGRPKQVRSSNGYSEGVRAGREVALNKALT